MVAIRSPLVVSARDRRIVALARAKLRGERVEFDDALRALREAVEELIPAGRTFLLGASDQRPIVGSIISGVGIVDDERGVQLVRAMRDGRRIALGAFAP